MSVTMTHDQVKHWNALGLGVRASQPDLYGMLAATATVFCDTGGQHFSTACSLHHCAVTYNSRICAVQLYNQASQTPGCSQSLNLPLVLAQNKALQQVLLRSRA